MLLPMWFVFFCYLEIKNTFIKKTWLQFC